MSIRIQTGFKDLTRRHVGQFARIYLGRKIPEDELDEIIEEWINNNPKRILPLSDFLRKKYYPEEVKAEREQFLKDFGPALKRTGLYDDYVS